MKFNVKKFFKVASQKFVWRCLVCDSLIEMSNVLYIGLFDTCKSKLLLGLKFLFPFFISESCSLTVLLLETGSFMQVLFYCVGKLYTLKRY